MKKEYEGMITLCTELFGTPAIVDGGSRDGWDLVAVWGSDTAHTKTRVQVWIHPETLQIDFYFGLDTVQYAQYRQQIRNAYMVQLASGTRVHRKGTENVLKFDNVAQSSTVLSTWKQRYGVVDVKNAVKDSTGKNEVKTA